MQANKQKRFPTGKVIAIAIVLLAVAALANPNLLFFLSPSQQQAIADFQSTYFTARNPIQAGDGSFDPLCLLSLVVLIAECWVVNTVVQLFAKKVTLKSRHAETIKSLACNCVKYAVVIYALIFGLSILGGQHGRCYRLFGCAGPHRGFWSPDVDRGRDLRPFYPLRGPIPC